MLEPDRKKLAVYIGRFQPFHKGHYYVINQAYKNAETVLVLVGSAYASKSIKNPFPFEIRKAMIKASYPNAIVEPLADYLYEENQWITDVQMEVHNTAEYLGIENDSDIVLIGHTKDESSYYLKSFPQWSQIELEHWEAISATDIRELMFTENKSKLFYENVIPKDTFKVIESFIKDTNILKELTDEFLYIKSYKKSWEAVPYPPIFVTVDAVVVQSGHILLVKRGNFPGKGLWALPGGFLNNKEKLLSAVIRELREETKLKVPVKVLEGSIKSSRVFDYPDRSTRGRTITHAYLFQLDNSLALPKVKGSDDAIYAEWIPLTEFYSMENTIYEDHYHIVRSLIDNS